MASLVQAVLTLAPWDLWQGITQSILLLIV